VKCTLYVLPYFLLRRNGYHFIELWQIFFCLSGRLRLLGWRNEITICDITLGTLGRSACTGVTGGPMGFLFSIYLDARDGVNGRFRSSQPNKRRRVQVCPERYSQGWERAGLDPHARAFIFAGELNIRGILGVGGCLERAKIDLKTKTGVLDSEELKVVGYCQSPMPDLCPRSGDRPGTGIVQQPKEATTECSLVHSGREHDWASIRRATSPAQRSHLRNQ